MKKETCNNCTFYTAYYKQWDDMYSKLNNGYCKKHNKLQVQSENCECFKSNEQKEKTWSERRLKSLERALISINEIAQILKEKENEK